MSKANGILDEESITELGSDLAAIALCHKVWPTITPPRTGKTRTGFLKSQASDPILAMASEPAKSTVPNLGSATHEGLRSSHRRRPRR